MLRNTITILLIGLIANISIFAGGGDKEKAFAQKVKIEVARLGTGTDARIKVKLKDGSKLRGSIREVTSDTFFVTKDRNGEVVEVPYALVKQVKGNNLSKGVKITLGVALIAALIAIIVLAGRSD